MNQRILQVMAAGTGFLLVIAAGLILTGYTPAGSDLMFGAGPACGALVALFFVAVYHW